MGQIMADEPLDVHISSKKALDVKIKVERVE